MIREWLEYLSTEASPLARQFALVQQSIAIKERYLRCHKSWEAHLLASQEFLRAEIVTINPKSVAILGSGHLLETPIELFPEVKTIYLYDFVFPRSVRKIARQDPRVQLVETDLTGVLANLKISLQTKAPLPEPQLFSLKHKADLLISANILSQLPIHPVSYIMKKYAESYSETQITDFITSLLQAHIQMLRSQSPAVLLSDYEKIITDHKTGHQEVYPTLLGLEPLKAVQEWTWQIIPRGEMGSRTSTHLKVLATRF